MNAIKPCWRCGMNAMAMRTGRTWAVYCNNDGTLGRDVETCGASGPERETEADAIASWNMRVDAPKEQQP